MIRLPWYTPLHQPMIVASATVEIVDLETLTGASFDRLASATRGRAVRRVSMTVYVLLGVATRLTEGEQLLR